MNSISRFLSRAWRPAILVISLGLILYLLYFHRLGTLLPGYASAERQSYEHATSVSSIIKDPLNAPYAIGVLVVSGLHAHDYLSTRIAAALCGVAAVVVFFCIIKAWFGFRVGFLATLLFATSSGFLHVARLGTPQVLQLSTILLVGMLIWHRRSPRLYPWLTYAVVVVFAALLYVPGMVWFELAIVAAMYKRIRRHILRTPLLHRILWAATGVVVLMPLSWALLTHTHLILPAFGLPHSFGSVTQVPEQLLQTVLSIGVRSHGSALTWLGHTPLLNVIELILATIGVYYYVVMERSLRSILLAASSIVGIVLISLGGGITITALVPMVYILVAGGLYHLTDEWLSVFPRNPIARGFGMTVIVVMLGFSVFYHVQSYFVAWPHNPTTMQTFTLDTPRSHLLQ